MVNSWCCWLIIVVASVGFRIGVGVRVASRKAIPILKIVLVVFQCRFVWSSRIVVVEGSGFRVREVQFPFGGFQCLV